MEMVIQAWRDLEGERPLGFGAVGLIPFRAIEAWADRHRLDEELFQMLKTVLQKLDADRAARAAAERALQAQERR